MLKRRILLIISAILIITSVGCSNKSKEKNTADTGKDVVVDQNAEKKDEGKEEGTAEKKENEDKESNLSEDKKDVAEDSNKNNTTTAENTKPKVPTNSNNGSGSTVTETKPPVTKPESPKPETPKPEEAKPETPKPEEVKPETPKPDESKPESGNSGAVEEKPEENSIAVKEIADKIMKDIRFGMVGTMGEDQAKEFYALDPSLVSEYMIFHAMINVRSDELAIFKVKDKKDIDKIKAGILKRQEMLNNIWKQYLPDQHEKVKNYVIVEKDNYIMYSISDNQEKAKEIFNSFFSK
jgi:hypothetical protein